MIHAAPRRRQNPMAFGQPAAGKPPTLTTGLSQPPSKHGLEPKTFHNIKECLVRKNDSGCDTGHLQPAPVGSTDARNQSRCGSDDTEAGSGAVRRGYAPRTAVSGQSV